MERDKAPPKPGIPNPSQGGNRIVKEELATGNNGKQGTCLGTKPGALQTGTPEQKRLRCRFVNDVATDLSSMSRLMTMAEDVGFEPTRGVNPARVPGV